MQTLMTTAQTITINEARTLANIAARAETLWSDGYKAELFACGVYHVDGPQGQHYMTTCDEVFGHHCTCPAFAKYGECKHHLAIAKVVADEAQAAAYDAQEADRDWFYFQDVCEQRNFFDC